MSRKPKEPETVPAVSPESPLVPNARLRQIYTMMLDCRLAAGRFAALAAEGRVAAALQPAVAEEALLAATAVDLRTGDTLCFAPQDWLAAMLKGVPLAVLARHLFASTGSRPRALREDALRLCALPSDPAKHPAIALEAALAHKRRKGTLAIVYTAGCTSLAGWEKVLQAAGSRRLPLLIVCRTPFLPLPTAAVPAEGTLESLAHANGIPQILVDGRDALAVYRVAQEAAGRARRGIGATLIECQSEGAAQLDAADPIAGMERHLASKGIFSPEWKQEAISAFAQQLDAAFAAASRARRTVSTTNH